MFDKAKSSFAFLVLSFNHEKFILEHLESIKYLVQNHGADFDVDLLVNDDSSRDKTCILIDRWIGLNGGLFRSIKIIYNKSNLGTCASVANLLTHMTADRCKITAGDDVYSFENIFELTNYDPNVAMLSGRALHLLGNHLVLDTVSNGLATATQVIYEHDSLQHRFKHFSYQNAPNILYATNCLVNVNVQEYLRCFDVTEDWPLQLAIARLYPEKKFQLIDKVLVYYRRTAGSTFIIANQRFAMDKIKIYNDLIHHENRWIEKVRLVSRKLCFEISNRWLNKILNIDFYCFALSCAWKARAIIIQNKAICLHIQEHQLHYVKIKAAAEIIRRELS